MMNNASVFAMIEPVINPSKTIMLPLWHGLVVKVEWFPHRVVHLQPDEPSEKQVTVDAFDKLALRADRKRDLKKQRTWQVLGRNRRTAARSIEARNPDLWPSASCRPHAESSESDDPGEGRVQNSLQLNRYYRPGIYPCECVPAIQRLACLRNTHVERAWRCARCDRYSGK